MKHNPQIMARILFLLLGLGTLCPVFAQDSEPPKYRSRAELVAARKKMAQTFPQEIRALRTLRLAPDKLNEAEMKLRQFELATRGANEELQNLVQQEDRQGYNRRSSSERVNELRTNLQQAREQLHAELKTLFTPQQREQFERRLQKERPKPAADRRNSR